MSIFIFFFKDYPGGWEDEPRECIPPTPFSLVHEKADLSSNPPASSAHHGASSPPLCCWKAQGTGFGILRHSPQHDCGGVLLTEAGGNMTVQLRGRTERDKALLQAVHAYWLQQWRAPAGVPALSRSYQLTASRSQKAGLPVARSVEGVWHLFSGGKKIKSEIIKPHKLHLGKQYHETEQLHKSPVHLGSVKSVM